MPYSRNLVKAIWSFVGSDGVIHLHSGSECCLNPDTQQPMNLHLKNITGKLNWGGVIDPKLLEDWVSRIDLWVYSQRIHKVSCPNASYVNAVVLKDLQMCESHMVYCLNRCDMSMMIQKMWRGHYVRANKRLRAAQCLVPTEVYVLMWQDAATKIQTSWRRWRLRNEISCRKALRQIDLRLCRARYNTVIDASEKIHKAWAAVKMRRRLYELTKDQQRKHFIQTHGLYDIFERAVDMAMRKGGDSGVYFDVANNMHVLGGWRSNAALFIAKLGTGGLG